MKRILVLACDMVACGLLAGCAALPGQQSVINPRAIHVVTLDTSYVPPPVVVTPVPAELTRYYPSAYRIGAGDILRVVVWDHPELGSLGDESRPGGIQVRVRADGHFFFPYVGLLAGAGMTVDELRQELTLRLARVFVEPQVDVSVSGFHSQQITVSGAFVHTSPQAISSTPLSLAAALGSATIDATRGHLGQFTLTREGKTYRLDLDTLTSENNVSSRIFLKGADHLYLPITDLREVTVLGEVLRPIVLTMRGGSLNLAQALGRAGGLDQVTGRAKSVYVIRSSADGDASKSVVFRLDARSPAAFAVATRFGLAAGDVVFVGASGITRWTRLVRQLFPWATTLRAAAQGADAATP